MIYEKKPVKCTRSYENSTARPRGERLLHECNIGGALATNKTMQRRDFLKAAMGTGVVLLNNQPGKAWASAKTAKKLQVALCGLGRYAGYLADGIAESRYCRVAGIVTGTPSKKIGWQQRFELPDKNCYSYETFDQIATNKDIDLVYVVLPNGMHKEYVIRAAAAGKHVIVEKPMALTADDCREMIAACRKAGVALAVGYRLHYEPYNQEMARLGQNKIFGPVEQVESALGYRLDSGDDWHFKKALSGGGPLMNIGIYCVQAARYITGEEPVAITAQFGRVTRPFFQEIEESISWQLRFPSGAIAESKTSYGENYDRVYVQAKNGFFELSPAISYGPFKGRSSTGAFHFPVTNQQAVQMDAIAAVLLSGGQLPAHISGEEGLKDMIVIDAIYKAAANDGRGMLPR